MVASSSSRSATVSGRHGRGVLAPWASRCRWRRGRGAGAGARVLLTRGLSAERRGGGVAGRRAGTPCPRGPNSSSGPERGSSGHRPKRAARARGPLPPAYFAAAGAESALGPAPGLPPRPRRSCGPRSIRHLRPRTATLPQAGGTATADWLRGARPRRRARCRRRESSPRRAASFPLGSGPSPAPPPRPTSPSPSLCCRRRRCCCASSSRAAASRCRGCPSPPSCPSRIALATPASSAAGTCRGTCANGRAWCASRRTSSRSACGSPGMGRLGREPPRPPAAAPQAARPCSSAVTMPPTWSSPPWLSRPHRR
jgi:hypothetical protein